MTRNAEDYRFWRGLGRCIKCHGKDARTLNGRCCCGTCAEKEVERNRKYYFENDRNLANKERYYRRKEQGLCVRCGRPAVNGIILCLNHQVQRKKEAKERYEKSATANFPRGGNGLCWQCNKRPALDGKRMCKACYDKAVETIAKNSPGHVAEDHPWRMDKPLLNPSIKRWLDAECPRR